MSSMPIHLETREASGASRLSSPSAGRNQQVIAETLQTRLPKNARVLEIASGTGEHALAICRQRSDIVWQNSDPDARSRASQDDWAKEAGEQILPALSLDMMQDHWWKGMDPYGAMFCANMIHIAPFEAAIGYVRGAAALLKDDGMAFLYGPFLEGSATATSNLEFDKALKARNPDWGVRSLESIKHIFVDVGFNLQARLVMPKENRLLIFSRRG